MTTTVYPITFGDPAALRDIALSIVGEDGSVALDEGRGRLIIATTEVHHRELADLLVPDVPLPANVRIHVQFDRSGRTVDAGASAGMSGKLAGGTSGWKGSVVVSPVIHHRSTESDAVTRQQIMVASGRSASIRVGESVPYLDWITEYGWHHGYIRSRIQWQEAGAFLSVYPTVLADGRTLRIRLVPELRGLVDGNPYHVAYTELATEVIVGDGQTVDIGGGSRDDAFYERFLIGFSRQGVADSLRISLTPEILPPPAVPPPASRPR